MSNQMRIHPARTTTPAYWRTVAQSLGRIQVGQLQDDRERHRLTLESLLAKAKTLSEQADGGPLQDRTSELACELETALNVFTNRFPYVSTTGELTT